MKKFMSSFTMTSVMLLTCLICILTLPGCDKNVHAHVELPGSADTTGENSNPDNGPCIHSRDKYIGTYSIESMDCLGQYGGLISQLRTIEISAYAFRPELATVTFPDHSNLVFGTGIVYDNGLRVLNTRISANDDYVELTASLCGDVLSGRFVITRPNQSITEQTEVCHFVASRTE